MTGVAFTDALQVRLQGVDLPVVGVIPVQFIQALPYVLTVLLLLGIGIVGTLGHFGSLGHSPHLPVGLSVVALTLASAWSATQINHPQRPWARSLHITINVLLAIALIFVSWTGWTVVQKYL